MASSRVRVAVAAALAGALFVSGIAAAQDEDVLTDLLRPAESFAPVEIELEGTLPRSGEFLGTRFTVMRAHLTNTHPYTMFGEPRPGEAFFVVLTVRAENPTDSVIDYSFDDEAFGLRTYSGQMLAHVRKPGSYDFHRLEPGDRQEDDIVFGSEAPDILDGAALLVGRPPDLPTVIPLTAPPLPEDFPAPATPATSGPFPAGPVTWSILGGEATIDRPVGVCCPDTGARADEGELFLTLRLSGLVSGSRYGQATVASDAVRLIVAGEPIEAFDFAGQANVPEGETYAFPLIWLVPEAPPGLAIEFLDGGVVAETVPILIGLP